MRYKELGLYNVKTEEVTVTDENFRISTCLISSNTYTFMVHAVSNHMESIESRIDHKLSNRRSPCIVNEKSDHSISQNGYQKNQKSKYEQTKIEYPSPPIQSITIPKTNTTSPSTITTMSSATTSTSAIESMSFVSLQLNKN